MKLTLKDLIVATLVVLGILGSINWIEIPFWLYLLLLVAYAGLRLAKKEDIGIYVFSVGGELGGSDDPNGPI